MGTRQGGETSLDTVCKGQILYPAHIIVIIKEPGKEEESQGPAPPRVHLGPPGRHSWLRKEMPASGPEVRKATRRAPGAYHFPMRLGSMRGKENGRRGHYKTWPGPTVGITAHDTDHCQVPWDGTARSRAFLPEGKVPEARTWGAASLAQSLGSGLRSPPLGPQ